MEKMRTYNELVKAILEILPDATFGEDSEGQIVIYTDFTEDSNGNLRLLEEPQVIASICSCDICQVMRKGPKGTS